MQIFPASYGQQGLWLSSKLVPNTPLYQLGVALRLPYRLDEPQLVDVFTELTRRHETLRTELRLEDGALAQVVHKSVPMPLTTLDLTDLPVAERDRRLRELTASDTTAVLDLDAAPLWRARLVRCAADDWAVVFVAHHAILDATSILNLRRELRELCRAAEADEVPRLPDLAIQYADFSAWQRNRLAEGDEHLAFWRSRLAGLPKTHTLPTDRPRPAVASHVGAALHFVLPADLTDAVRAAGRRVGATPFMVLLAAFNALVARLSGMDDVVLGTPVAGRDLPEVAPLIGMFVNTLVLRTDLTGDPSFTEIVRRTRQTALDAWEHQDTPFDLLVEALAPQRDAAHNPLFQLGFNFLPERGYSASGAEVSSMGIGEEGPRPEVARFDLHLDVFEQNGTFIGVLEYATDLFDAATARAFADRYVRLLTEGIAAGDLPVSRLPLLEPRERARLLETARPAVPTPAPLWDRLAATAAARPDQPAVGALTYAELMARAAALGSRLTGGPVALLPEDLPELAVSVLGAVHAGLSFLVADPVQPAARLTFLLRDAKLGGVVARAGYAGPAGVPMIDVHADGPASDATAENPDAPAWVCHPPARTGLPKRVGLSRRALVAAVEGVGALLEIDAGDVVGLGPAAPATLSVPVLLAGLLAGATVVPAPDPTVRFDHLAVTTSTMDVATMAPPARTLLVDGPPSGPGSGARTVHRHGFAECASAGLILTDEAGLVAGPAPNVGVAVLDPHGELVGVGMAGDLHLTGPTVGSGYLDRPQPSAAVFPANPFEPGTRMFRTGQRARWRPDGHLDLLT